MSEHERRAITVYLPACYVAATVAMVIWAVAGSGLWWGALSKLVAIVAILASIERWHHHHHQHGSA